ncbi:hypothetical protein DFH09DRAFT_1076696 [Mycena vulgaris]|nr:hypothetical protein DFH09DRAFT_1076696 [Mycena vulgaris]
MFPAFALPQQNRDFGGISYVLKSVDIDALWVMYDRRTWECASANKRHKRISAFTLSSPICGEEEARGQGDEQGTHAPVLAAHLLPFVGLVLVQSSRTRKNEGSAPLRVRRWGRTREGKTGQAGGVVRRTALHLGRPSCPRTMNEGWCMGHRESPGSERRTFSLLLCIRAPLQPQHSILSHGYSLRSSLNLHPLNAFDSFYGGDSTVGTSRFKGLNRLDEALESGALDIKLIDTAVLLSGRQSCWISHSRPSFLLTHNSQPERHAVPANDADWREGARV